MANTIGKYAGLIVALVLASVTSVQAQPMSGLGAIYPGGQIIQPDTAGKCGSQYIFRTQATVSQVKAFYIAQAAAAGLKYSPDPKAKDDPKFQILIFGDDRRMLEVVVTDRDSYVRVSVLHVNPPVGAPACAK